MNKVNWGFIGCGDVTEIKSGPAFRQIPNSEVVAVMRRNGEKAKDYAQRHGIAKWYDDAQKLIHDPEVNAVYIATPPDTHAKYTLQALEAGKPVYVEKPMALNYQECQQMLEAAEKAKLPIYVAFYRRRLPVFEKVKEILDANTLGDIRFVHLQLCQSPKAQDFSKGNLPWRLQAEIAGGGYFFDLASHQLDLLDYLLGPVHAVHGFAANQAGLYAVEDIVTANLQFESGVLGTGMWCFTTADVNASDKIEITGSEGSVTFSTFENNPIILRTTQGEELFSFSNPTHIQQPLIATVVGDLLHLETCPSTGVSAARTSKVMDEIIKDYRKK
jgi:predicted dehydrogenase